MALQRGRNHGRKDIYQPDEYMISGVHISAFNMKGGEQSQDT